MKIYETNILKNYKEVKVKNYYKILDIHPESSFNDILKSFRKLAKKYHPDLNKSPDANKMFIDIYEAYEILSDPIKKQLYDLVLSKNEIRSNELKKYEYYAEEARDNSYKYSKMHYNEFIKKVLQNVLSIFEVILISLYYFILRILLKITIIFAVVLPIFSFLIVYLKYSKIIFILHFMLFIAIITYLIYLDLFSWKTKNEDKNKCLLVLEKKAIIVMILSLYLFYNLYLILSLFMK